MANTLEYILKLKDEATAGLQSFNDSLEKTNEMSSKTRIALAAVGAAMTGMGVLGVNTLKDWGEAAAGAETEMAKFEAIMTSTYGKSPKLFREMRETALATAESMVQLGFDDEEASVAFAKLSQVTKDATLTQKSMAASADLARYKGIGLADAAQAMQMAFMGNTRILKQLGIEVNDNATKQEILAAVQGKVAKQAENYANTYAGQMDILNVKMDNFKEALGERVLPYMMKFADGLMKLVDHINAMDPNTLDLIVKGIAGFSAFALIVGPMLTFIAALPALAAGFSMVGGALVAAAPWVLLIMALVAAGYLLITNWELVKTTAIQVFGAVSEWITTALANIGTFFINLGTTISTFMTNLPTLIGEFLVLAFLKWVEFIGLVYGYLVYGIPYLIDTIISFLMTLPGKVWSWLVETYTQFTTWGTDTWNYLVTNVPVWFDSIVTWAKALPGRVGEGLADLKTKLIGAFSEAWNGLVEKLGQWKTSIWEWGKNIAQAFIDGFKNAIAGIAQAFTDGVNNAKKAMEGHSPPKEGPLKHIDTWGFNIGNAWVEGMRDAISQNPLGNSQTTTYNQHINVSAPINNNLDAYSLASILGQQLAFSGKYD